MVRSTNSEMNPAVVGLPSNKVNKMGLVIGFGNSLSFLTRLESMKFDEAPESMRRGIWFFDPGNDMCKMKEEVD